MITLVVPTSIADQLRDLVKLDVETGAILLVQAVEQNQNLRLLAQELIPVPEEHYARRESQELLIASEGYVPALGRAEEFGAVPVWLHTHPGSGSSPRASQRDDVVDDQLADLFRLRADNKYYGAVIVASDDGSLTFTGHLATQAERIEVDRMWEVGPRLSLVRSAQSLERRSFPDLFDRNIRAFGGDIQLVLGDLRVAVVGCGGTGSAVAEQLVRLGVRHLTLIDPDDLSASNLTRVYGSTRHDVDRPKVDVLGDHLSELADDVVVETVKSKITVESTARLLAGVDIAFGCTDDNAGRLVLSRAATYLLLPVIDCGVLLSSTERGQLTGIDGRVTLLYPGAACLVCRNRVDLARAGAEMLAPEERTRRIDEGYAPAMPGVEPAVVAYTTLVAAYAVGELLERLTRYGPDPAPSELLIRVHDREVSTNIEGPRSGHYCHASSGKVGLGETEPFLEQTWAA